MEKIYTVFLLGSISFVVIGSNGLQNPPNISETFSTNFKMELGKSNGNGGETITGYVHRDFDKKKMLVMTTTSSPNQPERNEWSLKHYDTKKIYTYTWQGTNPQPTSSCMEQNLLINISSLWSWAENTVYNDTVTFNNQPVNIYIGKFNGLQVAIGINKENVPFFVYDTSKQSMIDFTDFNSTSPDPKLFAVPNDCLKNEFPFFADLF